MAQIDPTFLALPARRLADAALGRARELGAEHADFRLERIRVASFNLRDAQLESATDTEDVGLAVRVVHDGAWGFAAGIDLTPDGAARLADQAVATARMSKVLSKDPVVLAPEATYSDVTWISAYELDPFDVAEADRVGRLTELSERLMAADGVDHVDAHLTHVLENKFYADSSGTTTTQQRVRLQPQFTAVQVDRSAGAFSSMRTLASPTGRGWEYLNGVGCDLDGEIAELGDLLAEHVKAPSVEAGRYDLVVDPTNLWLTIHESIGHATELDRAMGYEANYAGTSFVSPPEKVLGTLKYGPTFMNIQGDRTQEGGCATIGWDDDGVKAESFLIIKDGIFHDYQTSREQAPWLEWYYKKNGMPVRSHGCCNADNWSDVQFQRMPNVSLVPGEKDTRWNDLVAATDRGIAIVGDGSFSIDQQRYNAQFGGQVFYEIKGGKIAGMLKDVAYQMRTPDFWNAMDMIGGKSEYMMGASFFDGKGQPGQIGSVSHGCVPARFRNINVINTGRKA